jgi:hypothetical protein
MTKDFKAAMLKPAQDAEISIIDFNGKMAICADEGPILVTKEQAMKFFDLQPATTVQEPVGEWVGGRSKDSDPKRISWKPGYVSSAKVGDKIYTAPPAAPVPLTPEQRKNLWVSATIELPSQENCYYRGLLDAEAYHGITKKGGAA